MSEATTCLLPFQQLNADRMAYTGKTYDNPNQARYCGCSDRHCGCSDIPILVLAHIQIL